jgi:MATE family multidrug resistance protein
MIAGLFSEVRQELRPMVRIAAPLAMAELGWMAMGFVDTVMAGRLGAAAMGAGSLGGMLFFPIVVSATGMLYGMDTEVSQSFGARDEAACRRTLIQGIWLAAFVGPLAAVALLSMLPLLRAIGTNPDVMQLLGPFVTALACGVPPLLLHTALRRYLQAINIVKPITFAVVSANAINFVGNWVLMYGHWGAPRLGLTGSGISTSISRTYIALVLVAALVRHERQHGYPLLHMSCQPVAAHVRRLAAKGLPVAAQILAEGAVFGIVTVMVSRLDVISLAAHGMSVNVIAITYMVPLGISSAAAVRVGQSVGRGDLHGAAVSGWTALVLSGIFMGTAAAALVQVPGAITRLYTPDTLVIPLSMSLLRIAASFELFDGFQVVACGALRGLGDTRSPAIAHFVGYWLAGMPLGWFLCFPWGWGVRGIWVGLALAMILIGIWLVNVWRTALAAHQFFKPRNKDNLSPGG